MIISASYRTDIPCFYGEWFMRRLDAGYCRVLNPYGGQVHRVDLRPRAVDGFVFWTKNPGPFLGRLSELRRRGYPFVVQYAINAYPRSLEVSVVDVRRSVEHVHAIAADHGPRTVVWRYDPIVITSLTPVEFHRENFAALAEGIRGATDEVVISFAQIYRKTRRHLEAAAARHGFAWEDPSDPAKRELAGQLLSMARRNGMRLTVCAQQRYVVPGAGEARCVDARRLADVAGHPVRAPMQGNREDCRCHRSRDIGDYDTCPHGCVYCYAVNDHTLARRRHRRHDPAGELLFTPDDA